MKTNETQIKEFRNRALGKGELARLYLPDMSEHSATNRLSQWIHGHRQLMEKLSETGYYKHQRLLTPRQVSLIVQFLGEP